MSIRTRLSKLERLLGPPPGNGEQSHGRDGFWGSEEGHKTVLGALLIHCQLFRLTTRDAIRAHVAGLHWAEPPGDEALDAMADALVELVALPRAEQERFLGTPQAPPDEPQARAETPRCTLAMLPANPRGRRRKDGKRTGQ